jgi:RHS repeat-associated protein
VERTASDLAKTPFRFTGKELDEETGLYYYGARYLNPQTGMWLSADPAMGEYIPRAPVDDEARKYNQNLPGMGGVFNYVNLHTYHYAGNNPVKLKDPTGRLDIRLGFSIRGVAIKIKIKYAGSNFTTGIKVGFGAGFEAKVIMDDMADPVGQKISLESNMEVMVGDAAVAFDSELSTTTSGETTNAISVTGQFNGVNQSVKLENGELVKTVSQSDEVGYSTMTFVGVGYETTMELNEEGAEYPNSQTGTSAFMPGKQTTYDSAPNFGIMCK